MVPAGDATEAQVVELLADLSPGDIIVDGGNTNWKDVRAAPRDVRANGGSGSSTPGVSGGIWGLANGYAIMAGGEPAQVALARAGLPLARSRGRVPARGRRRAPATT